MERRMGARAGLSVVQGRSEASDGGREGMQIIRIREVSASGRALELQDVLGKGFPEPNPWFGSLARSCPSARSQEQ